jgi:hypothetical protein
LPVHIENISSTLIAYPNPASKPVTFEFRINESAKATLDLFSASGQLVATIFNRWIEAGEVQKVYLSNSLAAGTSVYTLRWSDQKITGKLIITH